MDTGLIAIAEKLNQGGVLLITTVLAVYFLIRNEKDRQKYDEKIDRLSTESTCALRENAVALERLSRSIDESIEVSKKTKDSIDRNTTTLEFLNKISNFVSGNDKRNI